MIVGDDQVSSEEESNNAEDISNNTPKQAPRRALVSVESAELLQTAGGGSLGKWYFRKVYKIREELAAMMVRVTNPQVTITKSRNS